MGFVLSRTRLVRSYLAEVAGHGANLESGPAAGDLVVLLDGVGWWQSGPYLVRSGLRRADRTYRTLIFNWHRGPIGEMLNDLICLKQNRQAGARLAARLTDLRRDAPDRKLHVVAFSGGCGVACFAVEQLDSMCIDTLVLFCPALSPEFNLAPALRNVHRCYAGVSPRDTVLLGLGTRLFGTTDRVFGPGAGNCGFRTPPDANDEARDLYQRKLRQLRWRESWRAFGHFGGHMDWASVDFIRTHLPGILRDEQSLDFTVGG